MAEDNIRIPARGDAESVTIPGMPQEKDGAGTAMEAEAVRKLVAPEAEAHTGVQDSAEDAARLRVWEHLADLAERLDPDSFALFLKVLSGVNAAFARRNDRVELALTPEEQRLYTPQLEREVANLLEKASFPSNRIVADIVPVNASGEEDDAAARAHEREA
ncbi:hypothetical protein [Streptomyces sp. ODS28]|uniref:hypothetical protein n=1 Tax=Streptomyces sp. ODS28 TaxID=3136688 RepID=UPI0031E82E7E